MWFVSTLQRYGCFGTLYEKNLYRMETKAVLYRIQKGYKFLGIIRNNQYITLIDCFLVAFSMVAT